jgi:uncharacterized protein (TIRG00374 family)
MYKNKTKYFVSLLLGFILLAILIYVLDVSKIYNIYKNINIFLMILSFLLISLTYLFRALRWKTLLNVFKKKTKFTNIFSLTVLSYYINIIAPFRFGEIVRLYLLRFKENISIKKSSTTLIMVSFLEILAALFWGFIGLILAYFNNPSLFLITDILLWAIFITFILFIILMMLMIYPKLFTRIFQYFLSFFPFKFKEKISIFVDKFFKAFSNLKNIKVLFTAFCYALCVQLLIIIAYYLMFLSFNINIAPIIVAIGNLFITFTLVIPTTPGRVGSYEAVWLVAFLPFGFIASEILAVSIGAHLVVTLCALLIGSFSACYLGIKSIDKLLKKIR